MHPERKVEIGEEQKEFLFWSAGEAQNDREEIELTHFSYQLSYVMNSHSAKICYNVATQKKEITFL